MILRAGSVAAHRIGGSSPRIEERFGDVAGLRAMGVNVVTLAPGERSAMRHWHSGSEEFVLILDGTATVRNGEDLAELGPGDLALWAAGVATAHQILNRTSSPLGCLCAGTNPTIDTVRYPDEGQTLHWNAPQARLLDDQGQLIREWTE